MLTKSIHMFKQICCNSLMLSKINHLSKLQTDDINNLVSGFQDICFKIEIQKQWGGKNAKKLHLKDLFKTYSQPHANCRIL